MEGRGPKLNLHTFLQEPRRLKSRNSLASGLLTADLLWWLQPGHFYPQSICSALTSTLTPSNPAFVSLEVHTEQVG